jgi:hypothetical protein
VVGRVSRGRARRLPGGLRRVQRGRRRGFLQTGSATGEGRQIGIHQLRPVDQTDHSEPPSPGITISESDQPLQVLPRVRAPLQEPEQILLHASGSSEYGAGMGVELQEGEDTSSKCGTSRRCPPPLGDAWASRWGGRSGTPWGSRWGAPWAPPWGGARGAAMAWRKRPHHRARGTITAYHRS